MNNKLHLVDTRSGQRLWLWWVLATSLPASLALIVLNWWLYLDVADNPQVALSDDNAVGSLISFGCGLLFIGLLVGVAQGWALHVGWWSNDWSMWILVDALGAVLVVLAALLLSMLTSGSGNGWIWI